MSAQPMSGRAVCSVVDVPEGTAHRVVVDGIPIAVVHTDGQWFAVSDICSHADVSLSEGDVDGCTLECWLHGSRFDLRTGQPSGPPAVHPIAVYPIMVEGDAVLVTIPTA